MLFFFLDTFSSIIITHECSVFNWDCRRRNSIIRSCLFKIKNLSSCLLKI